MILDGQTITGIILITFGGLSVLRPKLIVDFRIWSAKKIYRMDMVPSARTILMQRIIGILFMIFGVLVLNNLI